MKTTVSVSTDFPFNSKRGRSSPFQSKTFDCSSADCGDYLKDVSWDGIFKLGASAAAAAKFVS